MNVLELFKPITTFVFDIDGVLTDGSLLLLPGGAMARKMNIKDGYALQLAVKKGYHVVAISGASSDEVKERLLYLGIKSIFMRVEDKLACLRDFMGGQGVDFAQVMYMGDDVPDVEVMGHAGLACCPADAVVEVKDIAHYISPFSGGMGCARDVIEKVLKLNGNWMGDKQVRSQ
ncbi:KdsC family phosphatase [Foetidibacter luteolus]|uniref:KdsC family phosphatase n=1 Tax=Foetidibacter luteolus TaxID=2608880 RepID=UPI00129B85DE|nr:HAD hydrolase family protein [Foetidibacter luteolus]